VGEFSTQFGIDYGMMMAGGLLASIPPVIIALFFQPLLVRGLTAGSIKG
jgi:multiple sugar transport system permease protein